MVPLLPLFCVVAAIIILVALCVIDLKRRILPDGLNLSFAIAGILFHVASDYRFMDFQGMLAGCAMGAGFLYAIRFVSNWYYKRDTLGLGDVKLMGAAGIWLGYSDVLNAITVGAFAGVVHGLAYAAYLALRYKKPFSVAQLSIPAGPGFATGIVVIGYFMFAAYVTEIMHDFFA